MDFLCRDNIVAEITPVGKGAVSALRISGRDSKSIVEKLFNARLTKPRNAYFLRTEIDDLVVIYYKAPNSYTGEDICEIFCHGSPFLVNRLIDSILAVKEYSIRIAHPGEFTKRAYLNNKMDLIQAEAVADIINSSDAVNARSRSRMLKGGLSIKLKQMKEKLLKISGLLELEIDFEEEKAGVLDIDTTKTELKNVIDETDNILASYSHIEIAAKDITVAIIGDTNVGKSSLFNRLIGKERAIVHHVPGTTRDYIEARVELDGRGVVIIDTAGFGSGSGCEVELDGIRRSKDITETALFVVEVFESEDYVFKHTGSVKVRNKIDIKKPEKIDEGIVYVSAKTGEGIMVLRNILLETITRELMLNDSREYDFMLSKRQHVLMSDLYDNVKKILFSFDSDEPIDGISCLLRQAVSVINKILGEDKHSDETMEEIFSKFCIGK